MTTLAAHIHDVFPVAVRRPPALDHMQKLDRVLDTFQLLFHELAQLALLRRREGLDRVVALLDPGDINEWPQQPGVQQLAAEWRHGCV